MSLGRSPIAPPGERVIWLGDRFRVGFPADEWRIFVLACLIALSPLWLAFALFSRAVWPPVQLGDAFSGDFRTCFLITVTLLLSIGAVVKRLYPIELVWVADGSAHVERQRGPFRRHVAIDLQRVRSIAWRNRRIEIWHDDVITRIGRRLYRPDAGPLLRYLREPWFRAMGQPW